MRTALSALALACVLLPAGVALGAGSGVAALSFDPPAARVSGTAGAVTTATLAVRYDGTQVTQGLRGFHLAIDFNDTYVYLADVATDVTEGSFLSSMGQTAFFAVRVDANSIVIDGALLGATPGALGAGDLCSITFHGQPVGDGVSPVTFVDLVVRDPDNMPIPFTSTAGQITLDNTPPRVPTIAPLPTYTKGTTNTIYWSNESASGAVGYCCESAKNPLFNPIDGTSGCTPLTQFTFTDLHDGQIYYYRVKDRDDLWNTSAWSMPRHSTQDATPPTTLAGPLDPYRNVTTFYVSFTANDATSGVACVRLFCRRNGGTYSQCGISVTNPILFTAPGEGVYDFYTVGDDVAGNAEPPPVVPDCTTEVDLTPPPSVVDFRAEPGHNQIHLSWTAPASRASPIEGTLIVRKAWGTGAYPEYGDWGPPAGYPMNPGAGTFVAFVPGAGARTYDDASFSDGTRNVYYYQAFARDMAGNYSSSASTARDRSTSYWLADVAEPTGTPGTYDGYVDYYDKIVLSYSYSTVEGSPFYENEMDVGPTDDGSRFGIPLTDNAVEFEDLMIVAMNYGRVNPAGRVVVPVLAGPDVGGELELALELVVGAYEAGSEVVVDLKLAGNRGDVKGVSAVLSYDPLALVLTGVTPGGGLTERSDDVFFYSSPVEGADGEVRIDMALLGTGAAIGGSGTLATLTFDVLSAEPATVGLSAVRVRGVENESISCATTSLPLGAGADAFVFQLGQNIPNPFNPQTTIAFSIPTQSEVRLDVYSTSGRLVRRLVDGVLEAGARAVVWNGRDDRGNSVSSGVYLYALEACGERQVRKMVLTK